MTGTRTILRAGHRTDVALSAELLKSYRKRLEAASEGCVHWVEVTPEAMAGGSLQAVEIAITGLLPAAVAFVDVITSMPTLRWLHHLGAGLDRLPTEDLRRRGVVLTNSAGAYAPPIAEYALAAMVMASRGFDRWFEAQRSRRWDAESTLVAWSCSGDA